MESKYLMGSANSKSGQRCKGFTLLEVLVALSIVAIAVTVVLQLFSADLRALSASEDYVSAVLRAESRMREVLDDEGLAEKSWSETTRDGYRVDVNVSDVMQERTDTLQVRLVKVDLTTRWVKGTKEKSLRLETMKIVNKSTLGTGMPGEATSRSAAGAPAPAAATSSTAAPRVRSQ
jgi:general secretion pathway protein I